MTSLKWIFPNQNANEETLRQFELESIQMRTGFKPSDLETEIGRVNFFVFSPDRSMSANIDYETFEKWSLDFAQVCQQGGMSEIAGCLTVFELWNKTKKVRKATAFMPPLIVSTVASINLAPQDFIELKRITIFCTKKPDGGLDIWALKTPRHANER